MTTDAMGRGIPEWTVGDRLRKAREFVGLTQAQLADEIGISNRSISSYESGAAVKRPVLLSYAMRCGVPLEWLLTGKTGIPTGPDEPAESKYIEPRGEVSPIYTLRPILTAVA